MHLKLSSGTKPAGKCLRKVISSEVMGRTFFSTRNDGPDSCRSRCLQGRTSKISPKPPHLKPPASETLPTLCTVVQPRFSSRVGNTANSFYAGTNPNKMFVQDPYSGVFFYLFPTHSQFTTFHQLPTYSALLF